jgi:hypothetical protein
MPTPGPTVIGAPLVQGTMLEYLGFHLSFAHRAEAVPSDPLGERLRPAPDVPNVYRRFALHEWMAPGHSSGSVPGLY